MRTTVAVAALGVVLAAALGFAAHVVAQDTVGLPAVELERGRPLAPVEAKEQRDGGDARGRPDAAARTTTTAPTDTAPAPTQPAPATTVDDASDNSGPGSDGTGTTSDNSGPGSDDSGRGRGRGRGRGGDD